jgi:transcriptional regulator GlxA family with amidase domain
MRVRIFMPRIFAEAEPMAGSVRNASLLPRVARGMLLVMERRVVIVAIPEVQPLDVTGPAEVFAAAASVARRAGGSGYAVEVVAPGGGAVATGSGYALLAAGALEDVRVPLDTLLVAGGAGARQASADVVARVARLAGRARRVASVCTGAYVLAAAGLLDGRRATTHWAYCDDLERRHPAVRVERDPIFVGDGPVRTSAGVTAGMDLALALVEEDLGPRVALEVARWLVLFVKRPGGQAQFSAQLAGQAAERAPLRELQAWMADHLDADLSVAALAARAAMSERHFARAFKAETGMTPGVYVEALRVERARLALEGGAVPIDAVARRCGFGTVETLRRAFARRLGVSPGAYRDRFAA